MPIKRIDFFRVAPVADAGDPSVTESLEPFFKEAESLALTVLRRAPGDLHTYNEIAARISELPVTPDNFTTRSIILVILEKTLVRLVAAKAVEMHERDSAYFYAVAEEPGGDVRLPSVPPPGPSVAGEATERAKLKLARPSRPGNTSEG